MVTRVVVGAHYGLRDWVLQRVTAVIMALYTVFMAALLATYWPIRFSDWKTLFEGEGMRIFSFLFLLSLFFHAWVGVRDIFMDYVKPAGARLLLHVMVIFALVGYAVWSVRILWG